MSENMCITVIDEENNRQVKLNLTRQEFERANSDSAYLGQLIRAHDEGSIEACASPPCGDEGNSESSAIYIWTDACIKLLLALYEEHKEDFGKKRHKKVFIEIAQKMQSVNAEYTMTWGQCQSKLNSLKKTYKKILDHNSKSGNDRVTWPYFDNMNQIFGATGWAHPSATASEAGPENPTMVSPEPKKKRKLEGILQDFFEGKEKHMAERLAIKKQCLESMLKMKEQHHREKMELLRNLINK